MGKIVKSIKCGNLERWTNLDEARDSHEIPGTRVFWNNGHLYIVMPDVWSTFLTKDGPAPWDTPMAISLDDPELNAFFEMQYDFDWGRL